MSIAIQKLTQLQPDLIILDVEMPEMDGLQALKVIRATHPKLPVIMFSTVTERGAAATIDSLTLGASDYVTKPANVGSVGAAQQRVRDQLIPKIKALCGVPLAHAPAPTPRPTVAAARAQPVATPGLSATPTSQAPLPEIVAIGVSTGGPNALAELIPRLPATFPVPIVVVQHMPPMFTKFLADRLNSQSSLHVREAVSGDPVRPGTVLIAPGDHHMVLRRCGSDVVATLTQDPPENSCRPAVDVLLRSVNEIYGKRSLALILTGMGHDGLAGCDAIKRSGGRILAQDEATSVVWGMPGFVVKAGLADRVLPLPQIACELVAWTARTHTLGVASTGTGR